MASPETVQPSPGPLNNAPVAAPPRQLHIVSSIVVGGLASCLAEMCSYPFDFAKTRMQLHGTTLHLDFPSLLSSSTPSSTSVVPPSEAAVRVASMSMSGSSATSSRPYRGMLDVLRRVPREDPRGLLALLDGLKPALLRQATYGALKIVIYERLKGRLEARARSLSCEVTPASGGWSQRMVLSPIFRALLSAGTAGAVSAAICNPTDLLKVRMAAGDRATDPRYNRGVWRALVSIVRDEGVLGLYKGVAPTTQRAMVMTLLNLPSYDLAKELLLHYSVPTLRLDVSALGLHIDWSYTFKDDHWLHLMCGMVSAVISTYGSQPIDVIKSRIMNQPVDAKGVGLLYRSSWHCLTKTFREEGGLALFNGSVPNLCRSVPWLVIFFVSHEALKNFVTRA